MAKKSRKNWNSGIKETKRKFLVVLLVIVAVAALLRLDKVYTAVGRAVGAKQFWHIKFFAGAIMMTALGTALILLGTSMLVIPFVGALLITVGAVLILYGLVAWYNFFNRSNPIGGTGLLKPN